MPFSNLNKALAGLLCLKTANRGGPLCCGIECNCCTSSPTTEYDRDAKRLEYREKKLELRKRQRQERRERRDIKRGRRGAAEVEMTGGTAPDRSTGQDAIPPPQSSAASREDSGPTGEQSSPPSYEVTQATQHHQDQETSSSTPRDERSQSLSKQQYRMHKRELKKQYRDSRR
ncbi:unnamed protein product [Sympodiomycopsis kandeliae]